MDSKPTISPDELRNFAAARSRSWMSAPANFEAWRLILLAADEIERLSNVLGTRHMDECAAIAMDLTAAEMAAQGRLNPLVLRYVKSLSGERDSGLQG